MRQTFGERIYSIVNKPMLLSLLNLGTLSPHSRSQAHKNKSYLVNNMNFFFFFFYESVTWRVSLFIKRWLSNLLCFNVNFFLSSKNLTRKDYGSNHIKKTYRWINNNCYFIVITCYIQLKRYVNKWSHYIILHNFN